MSQAEQQAYEVLLAEAEARAAMVSIDCIETCLLIEKPDAALHEVETARGHFERLTKAA